jgi:UDP-glucose pyrophosphorylase
LGPVVWCARKFIGDEPFAVLLGDDIVQAENPCLRQLIDEYDKTLSSVIGVQTVPEAETHRYGIIDPLEQDGRRYQVRNFVEKPPQGTAPSNLAIMGRYVLTPEIFMFLEEQQIGAGGEIQFELGTRGSSRVDLQACKLGVIMVIAVSCVKLLSAHNSTQHTSRKHKV